MCVGGGGGGGGGHICGTLLYLVCHDQFLANFDGSAKNQCCSHTAQGRV